MMPMLDFELSPIVRQNAIDIQQDNTRARTEDPNILEKYEPAYRADENERNDSRSHSSGTYVSPGTTRISEISSRVDLSTWIGG